jgi:hypothetical protein
MESTQVSGKGRDTIGKLSVLVMASIFVVIVAFVVMVLVIPLISGFFSAVEGWTLDGYLSILSLALLMGGLTFAASEYINKEQARQHEKIVEDRENAKLSYDIYQAIFKMLTAPEQEAARRWILANLTIPNDDEDIEAWYARTSAKIMSIKEGDGRELPEGQESLKLTLNCFDYIGFIAGHYWEVEKDSLDWISAPIAKVWRRIGPYVRHVRVLRGTSDYYLSAESIGERCVKWRQDKGLKDEIYAEKTL